MNFKYEIKLWTIFTRIAKHYVNNEVLILNYDFEHWIETMDIELLDLNPKRCLQA